ncbi:MAG: hypothetical protein PVH24_01885 [Candidatus Zixiibacteriota bacterium]|jgi:hypothetical protein
MQLTGYRAAQQRVNSQTANKLCALADIRRSYLHDMSSLLGTCSEVADPQPLSSVKHRRYAAFPYWNRNPFHTVQRQSSQRAELSSSLGV